jgi:hypothetical protein
VARVLHLATLLTYDGPQFHGTRLVDDLRSRGHDLQMAGMVEPEDSSGIGAHLHDFIVPIGKLDDFDVVIAEGGWNDDRRPDLPKMRTNVAREFVTRGGQLIIADVDRNQANRNQQSLREVADAFRLRPRYRDGDVVYIQDDLARDRDRAGFWFHPAEMAVDEWLLPALDGVESLLVSLPVALDSVGDGIAASGTSSTETLSMDLLVDRGIRAPWAAAATLGYGHVAMIGGGVTHDVYVNRAPGNASWIGGLVELFTRRTENRRGVARPIAPRNDDLRSLLEADESQHLERKTSFVVPDNPNVPTKTIQHAVGKSIVALANTDGGHLIVGQADDRTVVGLERDFATFKNRDPRDAFELALADWIRNNITSSVNLGLTHAWLDIDGRSVLVIAVPKAQQPVLLKEANDEVAYVRTMTRTDRVKGSALIAWIQGPRWQPTST